jgi:hypothetical protein
LYNLLEFGFNLSPRIASNIQLQPGAGLSGLPVVSRNGSGNLVVEYVRRRASGNPGISYAVEFAGSASGPWSVQTAEAVTLISATFERVFVTDPDPTGANARFARVSVSSP